MVFFFFNYFGRILLHRRRPLLRDAVKESSRCPDGRTHSQPAEATTHSKMKWQKVQCLNRILYLRKRYVPFFFVSALIRSRSGTILIRLPWLVYLLLPELCLVPGTERLQAEHLHYQLLSSSVLVSLMSNAKEIGRAAVYNLEV